MIVELERKLTPGMQHAVNAEIDRSVNGDRDGFDLWYLLGIFVPIERSWQVRWAG